MGLVELVDLIRRPEEVVMVDFSRVGKGTGDSSGSELEPGCSDRARTVRTLSLSPAGAATTPASTPRQ